jgi:hypothetical protein
MDEIHEKYYLLIIYKAYNFFVSRLSTTKFKDLVVQFRLENS